VANRTVQLVPFPVQCGIELACLIKRTRRLESLWQWNKHSFLIVTILAAHKNQSLRGRTIRIDNAENSSWFFVALTMYPPSQQPATIM
jgi:hypothetical protein